MLAKPRTLAGLLLCLGMSPAAAQDNPWRVPGNAADGWFGYGNAPQTYGGQGWGSQGQGASQGWGAQQRTEQPYAPPAWDGAQGRRGGEQGSYAALPRERLTHGMATSRSLSDGGTGYDGPGTIPQRPRQDGSRLGGVPDERRFGDQAFGSQPRSQPRIILGEFPPLDGEQRPPGSERQPPPHRQTPAETWAPPPARPTAPPAPPAPGYGQGYAAPGYAYGDPVLAGPSTLARPWGYGGGYGAFGGYGLAPYASPYGVGVPSPYGW